MPESDKLSTKEKEITQNEDSQDEYHKQQHFERLKAGELNQTLMWSVAIKELNAKMVSKDKLKIERGEYHVTVQYIHASVSPPFVPSKDSFTLLKSPFPNNKDLFCEFILKQIHLKLQSFLA